MPIYKTIFQITVLSDGPYDPDTLRAVQADIDDDAAVIQWDKLSEAIIEPADVKTELIDLGNNGTFFDNLPYSRAGDTDGQAS